MYCLFSLINNMCPLMEVMTHNCNLVHQFSLLRSNITVEGAVSFTGFLNSSSKQ